MTPLKLFSVMCAFTLVQVQCESVPNSDGNVDDIINIAKAALQALENIVDGVTEFALVALNGLESTLQLSKELILKLAEYEINKIGDEIFKKLDDLKKDANEIAIDIIECTEDREDDLKELLVAFLNKTGDCAVYRVDQVINSFTDIVLDIKNVKEAIKTISQDLEDCQSYPDVNACILEVIQTIERVSVQIPAAIKRDVELAKKRVDEIENYLFECEHDYINELEMKTQEIYNGIVECVEGKIHPNSVQLTL